MATALTMPLDNWVSAAARPVKAEDLNELCAPGVRRDYSKLTVEDAFPLLVRACQTRFGDLQALDFGLKKTHGPLGYSSALTVTGPDEIGIEFPNSGNHPTEIIAKMHAAYQAVKQGVVEFIMQSEGPNTATTMDLDLTPSPTNVKTLPKSTLITPATSSFKSSLLKMPPSPNSPPASKPPVPKKAASAQPKSKPNLKHPGSQINELLQKVYRSHRKMSGGMIWECKTYPNGVMARLKVKLPSGAIRSYGPLPTQQELKAPGGLAQYKSYPTAKTAKRAISTLAIDEGVLDFITSEQLPPELVPARISEVGPLIPVQPPRAPEPLPSYAGLSSYVAFDPEKVPTANNQFASSRTAPTRTGPVTRTQTRSSTLPKFSGLPPKPPQISELAYERPEGTLNQQVQHDTPTWHKSYEAQGGHSPAITDLKLPQQEPLPVSQPAPPRESKSVSPVNDVQVVDEMLGSPVTSRPGSSKAVHDIPGVDSESRPENGKPREANELLAEDERSESMDLETDAGTDNRGEPIVSNVARKVSLEMDEERETEEPPKKRQRTEPPISDEDWARGPAKLRVMQGTSYVDILSDYCLDTGQPQPQVTYQRHRDQSDLNSPIMYHVSILIDTRRYDLSKNYESVQVAEEKLCKRMLKRFGVRPKKL